MLDLKSLAVWASKVTAFSSFSEYEVLVRNRSNSELPEGSVPIHHLVGFPQSQATMGAVDGVLVALVVASAT